MYERKGDRDRERQCVPRLGVQQAHGKDEEKESKINALLQHFIIIMAAHAAADAACKLQLPQKTSQDTHTQTHTGTREFVF